MIAAITRGMLQATSNSFWRAMVALIVVFMLFSLFLPSFAHSYAEGETILRVARK